MPQLQTDWGISAYQFHQKLRSYFGHGATNSHNERGENGRSFESGHEIGGFCHLGLILYQDPWNGVVFVNEEPTEKTRVSRFLPRRCMMQLIPARYLPSGRLNENS